MKCLIEKIHALDELCSGESYGAVVCEFTVNNQRYIVNKKSLNRNTHKTRFILIGKNVNRDLWHPNTVFPLGTMIPYLLNHG